MGEMINLGSAGSADAFDLSQFYQIFFEEAGENLAAFESLLLAIDMDAPSDEDLNAIFRAAHSIKGGAATFGFADVTELTHELETLLDRARKHELKLTDEMVDCLLTSGDQLKAQLDRHQNGAKTEAIPTQHLIVNLRRLATTAGDTDYVAPSAAGDASVNAGSKSTTALRKLEIKVGPLAQPDVADSLIGLFEEIPTIGSIVLVDSVIEAGATTKTFEVNTSSSDSELLDLFTFYVDRQLVSITEQAAASAEGNGSSNADALNSTQSAQEPELGYGFFVDPATLPSAKSLAPAVKPEAKLAEGNEKSTQKPEKPAATTESATLRVSVEKVDQLINLVGELVITQAMLAQKAQALDTSRDQGLLGGLSDLERNTRDLQESVMSIRMIPMSFVFNRFPRMLRDLASRLGKQVELKTTGEATELDKGLIEKITDPLTHLVRNSVDHGIEMPDVRVAAGKTPHGTITLSAQHQGGSIVIEVRDDGRGLNREKILAKAREKGIPVSENITDAEVWQLIFAPGFSTADVVTDVSGRGVGMDVVKRNITALGGTVELDSADGYGTRVSVRLPLTLAIMDGMSVGVGDEVYILPLASVVETFQVDESKVKCLANQGKVVRVREEYLPVRPLDEIFAVPRFDWDRAASIMVIVEAEGRRAALVVDALIGQHQVVVKNLEANYRRVDGVSGATILGDGRVALILDINRIVA
jgi:two-component system, chemotaxis family, sensor kinase CheA